MYKKVGIFIGIILLLTAGISFATLLEYYGKIMGKITISSPVVINEIGYRGGPEEEFVELYSQFPNPIDLNGWRIRDNKEEDVLISFNVRSHRLEHQIFNYESIN